MPNPFYQTSEEAAKTINQNAGKHFLFDETNYVITHFYTLDMTAAENKKAFNQLSEFPAPGSDKKFLVICEADYSVIDEEDDPFDITDSFIFFEIANNILA